MSKVGIVSDVHGNLPALKAVLHELETTHNVDSIVCAGDIVGLLGSPAEVVSLVQEKTDVQVYGNHDSRFFKHRDWKPEEHHDNVEYVQVTEALSDEQLEWLRDLPSYTVYKDNVHVHVAHSNPLNDDASGTQRGDTGVHPKDFVTVGGKLLDGDLLIVGHTHYQHAVNLDKFDGQSGLMLNPGSVGFPWEDNGPAEYAVVDTETLEYELCSVEYDTTSVETHVKKSGLA